MLKSLVHLYWRLSRGVTLGVRGAVLSPEERVLLVRHSYAPGWHFPGGGVETGETLLDALARELREEGNVTLRGVPRLHGVFRNAAVSPRDHVALFVVREFEWNGAPRPGLEIREAAFFPVSELPDGVTAGTRRRLDEILGRRAPSPDW